MQNYVALYIFVDDQLQRHVLRVTIAGLAQQLQNTGVVRCHRSYLVHVDAIANVAGNAQGLRLALNNVPEFSVPVSRSYIPTLRALIA